MMQSNRQNRSGGYRDSRPQNTDRFAPSQPKIIKAESLPGDYADAAEKVIDAYRDEYKRSDQISRTKLRNLFSLIMDIYNDEMLNHAEEMTTESVNALQRARIRFVYESGRENKVKYFITRAKLLEYMKDIGNSRKKLMNYAHYMEALVAYHRFHNLGSE